MKKIFIISSITFLLALTPTPAAAFTRADIDMLVALDVISDTSFIPLLYLLAEDTPAPTTAELLAAITAQKETSEEKPATSKPTSTTGVRPEQPLQNLATTAILKDAQTSDDEEKGIYTFSFSLTAAGNDVWILDEVSESSNGFSYTIVGDTFSGDAIAFISDTSSNTKQNSRYKIAEGATENFELTVELNPDDVATGGIYSIQITALTFANSSSGSGAYTFTLSDSSKYRTSKLLIE